MIGFCLIGVYCFLASIIGAPFAKIHVSFPFVKFPLFIGEIVMLVGIALAGWRVYSQRIILTRLQRVFLAYLGGILAWTAYDCLKIGGSPLALRNAVLFFYPVFAFLIYVLYDPSWFSSKLIRPLSAVLVFLSALVSHVPFFGFIYFILFFMFLYTAMPQRWKFAAVVLSLLFWPYGTFLSCARTWLVSSVFSILLLIFWFARYFWNARTVWKILAGLAVATMFFAVVLRLGDKSFIKTFSTLDVLMKVYANANAMVQEKQSSWRPLPLKAQLYNTERDATFAEFVLDLNKKYTPAAVEEELPLPLSQKQECPVVVKGVPFADQSKPAVLFLPEHPSLEHPSQASGHTQSYKKSKAPKQVSKPLSGTPALPGPSVSTPAEKLTPSNLECLPDPAAVRIKNLAKHKSNERNIFTEFGSIVFRILIWKDMLKELWDHKKIFGFGLSHPQRSKSIEILDWASGEWSRDGWIAPHNSFLHVIYRAGIIGLGLVAALLVILAGLVRDFIRRRSVTGVLLSSALIYGLMSANFLLILELPYYAIPFWSLFGLTMAHRRKLVGKT